MSLASSRVAEQARGRLRTMRLVQGDEPRERLRSPLPAALDEGGFGGGCRRKELSADEKASSLEAIATSKPTAAHLDTGPTSPVPLAPAGAPDPTEIVRAGRRAYSERGISVAISMRYDDQA